MSTPGNVAVDLSTAISVIYWEIGELTKEQRNTKFLQALCPFLNEFMDGEVSCYIDKRTEKIEIVIRRNI